MPMAMDGKKQGGVANSSMEVERITFRQDRGWQMMNRELANAFKVGV
jgi:hypothetical protein